jgi:hypothetical protein
MTDGFPSKVRSRALREWALDHCINWVQSDTELNARLPDADITRVRSAATRDNPLTTHKAFPFIWPFFDEMMALPPVAVAREGGHAEPDNAPPVAVDAEPDGGDEHDEPDGKEADAEPPDGE